MAGTRVITLYYDDWRPPQPPVYSWNLPTGIPPFIGGGAPAVAKRITLFLEEHQQPTLKNLGWLLNAPAISTDDCLADIPVGQEASRSYDDDDDCDTFVGDPAYTVEDQYSFFGDNSLDECSIYIGDPSYTVVDEYRDGCCECLCIPPDQHTIFAAVSSTGGCPWNGNIELHEVFPRGTPKSSRCFRGTIGTGNCVLSITACCNCSGIQFVSMSTTGPTLCADDCCTQSGTCAPLEWTAVSCCSWYGGTPPTGVFCCTGCITVVVTR